MNNERNEYSACEKCKKYITLYRPIKYSHEKCMKQLIENHGNAIINRRDDKYGITPMYYAAVGYPNEEYVKILLEHGADINEKDMSGKTLLHPAYFDRILSLKILLRNGAAKSINEKDNIGLTPLHRVVKYRDIEFVYILI